mmetsp:Transcript_48576/g.96862  ORF Transcript_48576/g.96862 Transcript_48576/m.96862 type:complete len:294 (-) Transcript_48576:153-1034(-)
MLMPRCRPSRRRVGSRCTCRSWRSAQSHARLNGSSLTKFQASCTHRPTTRHASLTCSLGSSTRPGRPSVSVCWSWKRTHRLLRVGAVAARAAAAVVARATSATTIGATDAMSAIATTSAIVAGMMTVAATTIADVTATTIGGTTGATDAMTIAIGIAAMITGTAATRTAAEAALHDGESRLLRELPTCVRTEASGAHIAGDATTLLNVCPHIQTFACLLGRQYETMWRHVTHLPELQLAHDAARSVLDQMQLLVIGVAAWHREVEAVRRRPPGQHVGRAVHPGVWPWDYMSAF